MAWNKKEEVEEVKQPEITSRDIEKLRTDLKPFKQQMINGQLIPAFEQYLCSLGVMKYTNEGVVVNDAVGYTRMSKINSKLELRQYYEDVDFHEQNPEAKTAFQERIGKIRAKIKA